MKKLILILMILTASLSAINAVSCASADEVEYYIICKPGGEINIRERPKVRSPIVGCLCFGDKVISDGIEANGFIHVIDLAAEVWDGWIYKGLLVEDRPVQTEGKAQVFNAGKVACRKYASTDSKVKKWLKDGKEVEIYAISEKWCVTEYGYIKTEFLTVNAKVWESEN